MQVWCALSVCFLQSTVLRLLSYCSICAAAELQQSKMGVLALLRGLHVAILASVGPLALGGFGAREGRGIQIDAIDYIVYYENAILKLDRIFQFAKNSSGHTDSDFFKKTIKSWLRNVKYSPTDKLSEAFEVPRKKIHCVEHHQSHAASAFYWSPYEEATVVTLDGVGEYETLTISHGTNAGLKKLVSVPLPNSIGLFYSAVTAFLGFRVNEDEYKVMGMAGFGEPEFFSDFMSWFEIKDDGSVTLEQEFFNFLRPDKLPYTRK